MAKDRNNDLPSQQCASDALAIRRRPAWLCLSRMWPMILLAIVLFGVLLRLYALGQAAPPGLNQDEAANGWNAYCLLQTGKDQAGVSWPLFYSRCLGANRSTLYLYVLIPFQALGGLSTFTTRIPAVVAGALTIVLVFAIGRRFSGADFGLLGAGLIAVNPWHLFQSRWGHEAALAPLLVALPIYLWLKSGCVGPSCSGGVTLRNALWAGLAGLVTGLCCYGYPAVRLFMVVFLPLAIIASIPTVRTCLRTRAGALAMLASVAGLGITLGPLVYKHLTDDAIGKRGETTWVWLEGTSQGEPPSVETKIAAIAARYPGHFGPRFLFEQGDLYQIQSPAGWGMFHWYAAPLMLIGLAALIAEAVRDIRRKQWPIVPMLLLAWLLAYPVGDILSRHDVEGRMSMHALRSSPGLPALILLAAWGLVSAYRLLWPRLKAPAVMLGGILAVAFVWLNVSFLGEFFGPYNRDPAVYHGYQVDLVEASHWLKPRLADYDAVFVTARGMNQPYVVMMVAMGYDPHRWFAEPNEWTMPGEWTLYHRVGKLHFMYDPGRFGPALQSLQTNGRADRVLFIVRRGELPGEPVLEIDSPAGRAMDLLLIEQTL